MDRVMPKKADPKELDAIVKHGMTGPMAGQVYDAVLPFSEDRH